MSKRVDLSEEVYEWTKRHCHISEEQIIGVVLHTPENERIYPDAEDPTRFEIHFNSCNKGHVLKILLKVHERITEYMVYGAHCQNLS